MKFKSFLGNEKIKEQLSYLLSSNRLPHAIVIEGAQGMGKFTLARELAAALMCRSSGERPCSECSQCIKAQKSVHPDIYEYRAENRVNSFHIDVVRDIIKDVYISPNEAEYKVYILGNAHCMNENAQNAILKVLEEPPSYAVFILTAESKSMLLETVLSRAVSVSLEGVDSKLGADFITQQNPGIDYSEALNAMIAFGGNIGKARESLDGGKMQEITGLVNELCTALAADNEYELLKAVSRLPSNRAELAVVLNLLKTVFRDALTGYDVLSGQTEAVKLLTKKYTAKRLLALYGTAEELIMSAEKNANVTLLTAKICYSLKQC